jgi:hypothetical protein
LFALVCFPSADRVLAFAIDHAVHFIVVALAGDIAVYLRLLPTSNRTSCHVFPEVTDGQGANVEEPCEECLTRRDGEGRILDYEVYNT